MDSLTYMSNPALVGYKLNNLQYRNNVDTDNRYKIKPLYEVDILTEEEARIGNNRPDNWYSKRVKLNKIRHTENYLWRKRFNYD